MPKLCNHENCRNRASYALTYGNPDRCKEHREDRKPQYRICKCGKAQPIYNEPGQTKAICCKDCKNNTMVDVKHKKCKCYKAIPSYNEPGETKPICCKDCKTNTMVDVKNKKCVECGKARPIFNEPGETKAIRCRNCKTDTMVDVINKKCKANDETLCNTVGNRKYKGYCARCFQYKFPKDPLSFQIRSKTKEIAVRDFINTHFTGWQHDKPLFTGHCECTIRRRIDHRVLIGNTLLVVETDENQHKSYDTMDEEIRYHDLCMAYSGNWIYIRFNPDKYKSKNGKNKNPEISTRLIQLKKEIDKQIERIKNEENTEQLEIQYMYYDNYN